MKPEKFIHKSLAKSTGSKESTELYLSIDTSDGESNIVLSHTVYQRLSLNKDNYAKSLEQYEDLIGDGFVIKVEDLRQIHNRGKITQAESSEVSDFGPKYKSKYGYHEDFDVDFASESITK